MDHTDLFDVFSEEFAPFLPGSFVYCHPSEVESWTESVPFEDFALPSPPESRSDCETLESQDMSSQTWSQASEPDEWTPATAQEYSTCMQQPSASGWSQNRMPVTAQDIQTLDSAAWLSVSSGPASQGLSPVLSHESHSTHTLNSFSEPDCILPPGSDLSFTAESGWNPSGPRVYSSLAAFHASEQSHLSAHEYAGKCSGFAPFPQAYYPVAQPAVVFSQGGQVAYAPRSTYPPLVPKRPLLPRMEGSSQPMPATSGSHRVLRPHMQGHRELRTSVSSVSSTAGQPQGPQHTVAHPNPSMAPSVPGQSMPPGTQGIHHVPVYTQDIASSQVSAAAPYAVDPTAQDFSDLIHYDQEDQAISPAQLSHSQGLGVSSMPALSSDAEYMLPQPEQDARATYHGANSLNSTLAVETDEGRYRTHPLYTAEPQADGLFHCPYKAKDPNCPHKPTKLKCNYDKYIDSHLKPFRCKIDTCSKQEFSSTACLLRHEREAHGMHGHGDRPHLCFYTGCERGIPGNGFPRRYNLFDHMKRVHDHKDDPRSGTRSPSLGSLQDKKTTAAASRKRKASEPAPLESAVQRQKIMPVPAQRSQVVPAPQQVYPGPAQDYFQQPTYAVSTSRRTPAQSRVYHHWANQRDLIGRQMEAVQSPDDEAGLERLTQNVEQLQRLSKAIRRG